MTPAQWWVALGPAGTMVVMQFYGRARPVYDGWKSAPGQAQTKKR
jgi:hypothetical protein